MGPQSAAGVARIATDPAALEVFYRAHFDRVVSFVARRSGSPDDVADVVADVFVEAMRSAHRFDASRGEPGAWLLGIAANTLAARRRSGMRRRDLEHMVAGRELLASDDYEWLDERLDAERLAPALDAALRSLSANERSVLELVDVEGLSTVEAARALGIRGATARMRLTRARRHCARALGTDEIVFPTVLRKDSP